MFENLKNSFENMDAKAFKVGGAIVGALVGLAIGIAVVALTGDEEIDASAMTIDLEFSDPAA